MHRQGYIMKQRIIVTKEEKKAFFYYQIECNIIESVFNSS